MSIFKRGETWWLDIVHNGERRRRSLETNNRKDAQRIHDEYRAELWRTKPSGRTFHGALDAWLKAETRDAADGYRIDKLKKDRDDKPLHAVTVEYLTSIIPNTSPGTFNRYANLISAALNFAKKAGWLESVPHLDRKKPPAGRIRWLTKDEWDTLKTQLPDHQRVMASFALATGLRQANVLRLEWSQVDMQRKVAWIHPDQAKAAKAIGIPLSDDARRILRGQIGKHDQWVFPFNGKPVTEIKTAWGKALARAGIHDFTWHDLRHTWATWHIMGGTPVEVLQKLGGWADIRMVLRYAHFAPEYLAGYANNARPRSMTSKKQASKK